MNILHVITSMHMGGAEKLMVDLLPRLKDAGHNADLLIFDGTDTPFRRNIEAEGIKVYDLGIGGSVYSPLRLLKLIPFLRKYDVVHTHNTAPQLFAAIGSLICSVVLCTTEHTTSNRRRGWKWYANVDRWMYNRYRNIVCISKKSEENLRKYLCRCNADITTINNGVDVLKYANALASDELERVAPGSRKIIMVAGFRWEKDQDTLIIALKQLPEYFHLFLVGDGVRRSELEVLVEKENLKRRVHFLGVRTDVPQLLHAADYIVMSSHFEGLSLSSVEGMSVGKPFLASDVDGLREVVCGAGVLFPHQNPDKLAEEIIKLEENSLEYKTIADACFSSARTFDISEMASEYSNLYKSLNLLKS